MKIAVIDDETKATNLIESYIKKFGEEHHQAMEIKVFHNPNDFLDQYRSDFDLILMDIEMPGLDGIQTARELRRMDPNVTLIFITNMAQYAINGYEVNAVDFIVKPVSYPDFAMKMQKALRYISQRQEKKLTLESADRKITISVMDIHYIEVLRHYLEYHTIHGVIKTRGVMKEVEELLKKYHFVRCNHGYLVNLKYVMALNGNIVQVAGEELIISRNKKNDFMIEFTKYVGGMRA